MVHFDADEALDASRGGSPLAGPSAPHPHPSWGAGGPRQRAAGRVLRQGGGDPGRAFAGDGVPLRRPPHRPPAVLLEPDPLVRPAAEEAVRRLGFEPGLAPARVVFVNLAGLGACPSSSAGAAVLVIGYVAGRPLTGAAHALHGCCAQVLELRALRDGPAFTAALVPPALEAACPTPREADVLALVLAGATDRRMAEALGVAPSTVRSHVRAVLRKAGVADRRELRRLDGPAPADSSLSGPSGLRACGAQVRRDSPRGLGPVAQG